MQSWLLL